MRRLVFFLTVLALWGAAPLRATEFIETDGPLDDDTFYRIVACGAAPGQDCTHPYVRWPEPRALRVALERIDPAFLGGKKKRAEAALVRAVQYINQSGANVALTTVPAGQKAEITIHFIDNDGTVPLQNTGVDGLDGQTVRGATVRIWWRSTGEILRGVIVFSRRLSIKHYESAMLEELTQSLGLMTDIRNPHYEGVSIFSEDSNASKTLGPQDIMALRRHYPASE